MYDNNRKIINGLILSVNHAKPKIFLHFLKSSDVLTTMPNKLRFYQFFSFMVQCSSCRDNYQFLHKFKIVDWNSKRWLSIQFYRKNKKFPFLTFVFEYKNGKILLELLPL